MNRSASKSNRASKEANSNHLVVYIQTGDKKYAGTDANVKIVVHFESGGKTEEHELDNFFKNDFERGRRDSFVLKNAGRPERITKVEFWRDCHGVLSEWFVEVIEVEDKQDTYIFPVQRWIKAHFRYIFHHLDTSLPQFDPEADQRKMQLEEKRTKYEYAQSKQGMPVQVKSLPDDEQFSWDYKWNILIKQKNYLKLARNVVALCTGRWESLEDIPNIYTKDPDVFPAPPTLHNWNSDLNFGRQRLAGLNPLSIELCTSIPEKFGVTDKMVHPFLEGLTLHQVIHNRRLYIVDLHILKELPYKLNKVCAPLALFFVNKDANLMPIAIQLFQNKSDNNPVFLPNDPAYTWMLAKMWFNNADACIHQALSHLGFTHILMEGIIVCTHRTLYQSHPVFRLMAPHFLYLLAINNAALASLLKPDGVIDGTMNMGKDGVIALLIRAYSKWRMNVEGCLPGDLKNRGVEDHVSLPNYHFRDDAMLLYNAINDYVTEYIHLYYNTPFRLLEDTEIQNWAYELAQPKTDGGCGLNGVPGNGKFESLDHLIQTVTIVIYTATVGHAAVNFLQYDEYAFQPNYPSALLGRPPTDKHPLHEKDVMDSICDKRTTLNAMITTKILSTLGTNTLGYQEVQYIFDPEALKIVTKFQEKLKEVSGIIRERNAYREPSYSYLDPEYVPNSISI